MIIETEPSGLMMIRYKFYFNQQSPDPEDPWVLAYFQEHGLEPRRELHEEHEGIPYKVFHFGQCYLGRHVTELVDVVSAWHRTYGISPASPRLAQSHAGRRPARGYCQA